MIKKSIWLALLAIAALIAYLYFANGPKMDESQMEYGVSFGITRSTDMQLNWKEVYGAILNDLKVKRLRLIADWPEIEPKEGVYNFANLDYQMREAAAHNVQVILAIGRRAPGYPECHDPAWLAQYPIDKQQELAGKLVTAIVSRYRGSPALYLWQVENEPFFDIFTRTRNLCPPLDTAALQKEISLVRSLDSDHKIIITDGGELGTWYQAYQAGDVFGTSIYMYIWNSALGYLRYPLSPAYFRIKEGLMRMLFGNKPSVVIELQSEPWIPRPLVEVSVDEQLTRFDLAKMNEMIRYPYLSGFDTGYLWGAEWWYWMKSHGHPEFWQRAQQLFSVGK